LNWLVKGKILAFAGPSYVKTVTPEGYCTLSPGDYIPYFQRKNVGLVVRLNQKNYDEQQFIDAGIDHVEEFYTDGSCPHMSILNRVVKSFEKVPEDKGFAVHCKAGLGRTGTCIGAYLMKHYRMTAKECIGWMRICRPGMVIGPQQQFLERLQGTMWAEGDAMRLSTGKSLLTPAPMEEQYYSAKEDLSMSPSSKSMSTTSTVPETPDSVVIASVGSKEAGHEVILTEGSNRIRYNNDESTYEREKREGRPGQADGLLAARHNRGKAPSTSPSDMSLSPPPSPKSSYDNTDDENEDKCDSKNTSNPAVPVTPDNRANTSPSMWARAFA